MTCTLSAISQLDTNLDQVVAGLSFLVRGQTVPWPKLIWIGNIGAHKSGRKGIKGLLKNLVESDIEVLLFLRTTTILDIRNL